MQRPACDSNPLSAFSLQPPPPYIRKIRGEIPSSCVPNVPGIKLGEVPSMTGGSDPDLKLKLTSTGVTFLHERRFKERYKGSEACAVDINGRLWLSSKELKKESQKPDTDKGKKKKVGTPPNLQKLLLLDEPDRYLCGSGAISQEIGTQENFSPDSEQLLTKKDRKKSYRVNKAKVRGRILAYLNTQKGKKELFFWTVTFPAHTPDNVCYQAFNTWLTTLRQTNKLKDYLWIAERQTGDRLKEDKDPTNTIHFHIAIPHYMNVHHANLRMREILKNLAKKGSMPGAVCGNNGKTYYLPSISKYNGVDISKHRKTKRVINFAIKKGSVALANYLTKYITKNDSEFPHLAFHNSRGFSCLFTAVTFTLTEFKNLGFGSFLNRVRVFKMNFATFVPWLFGPPPLLEKHLYILNSFIQTTFDNEQRAETDARSTGANGSIKKRHPGKKHVGANKPKTGL